MKLARKIIEIDEGRCSGCGQCATACAEGAIEIIGGKAKLVSEVYCDGLGACIGECPEDALTIIERESEEFDPEAVEERMKEKAHTETKQETMACGCPSAHIHTFAPDAGKVPHKPVDLRVASSPSVLSHWPVQIKLIPPHAPFLKGADLLVAADCTSVAYPDFHRTLLPGKAVLIGCPKFDDVDEYVQKFVDIFRQANVKSVTVVDMEVPCCSKLPALVRHAMTLAEKNIPFSEIVISVRGQIIDRDRKIA
jgi:Pyruvate/2-oxoacid:ferredoxin oxidoreductase delta subunit